MSDLERLTQAAETASGFSKEEILGKCRQRPLPAIRWMIGEALYDLGYSESMAARMLQLNHATLYHGRKQLKEMPLNKNWRVEHRIYQKFQELCK